MKEDVRYCAEHQRAVSPPDGRLTVLLRAFACPDAFFAN
jgi:hypothetical protein